MKEVLHIFLKRVRATVMEMIYVHGSWIAKITLNIFIMTYLDKQEIAEKDN